MSSSFGYLIPKTSFEIGAFKKLVTFLFEEEQIIDGYYEEEFQWFAAGENSHWLFNDKNEDAYPAFEYIEIHDTINSRIIPDASEDYYGAKCCKCKADLDNSLSDVLMELAESESESGSETDMSQLIIECPNCTHASKISDIDFALPVRFNNQFICFVEIDSEFDELKIAQLASQLNCRLEILYGQF